MPGRYDKSKTLDADYATDCCATDDFLEAQGLWAGGAIYNNTSDHALPLSMFRTFGSPDLDSLWKAFMGVCTRSRTARSADARRGLHHVLDQEFGRGLSVSFMANQVPSATTGSSCTRRSRTSGAAASPTSSRPSTRTT